MLRRTVAKVSRRDTDLRLFSSFLLWHLLRVNPVRLLLYRARRLEPHVPIPVILGWVRLSMVLVVTHGEEGLRQGRGSWISSDLLCWQSDHVKVGLVAKNEPLA